MADALVTIRESIETMLSNMAFILGELPTINADTARIIRVKKAVDACAASLASDVLPEIDELSVKLSGRAWTAARVKLTLARSSVKKDLNRFHRMVVSLKGPRRRRDDGLLSVLVQESGVNIIHAYQRFESAAEVLEKGGRARPGV